MSKTPGSRRRVPPRIGNAFGICGITALLVATALPWIYSGEVGRNIYQLAGVAQHLGFGRRFPLGALAAIPPVAVLPVLLAALGWSRVAVACAAIWGAAAIALAVGTLTAAYGSGGLISIAAPGPLTIAAGGAFLLAAAAFTVRSWTKPTA